MTLTTAFAPGLLSLEQLRGQALFGPQYDEVHRRYPELEDRRLIYEIIRRMIDKVVTDLIENTQRNVAAAKPRSIDEVRQAGKAMVLLSDEIYEQHLALKRFLNKHLYSHEQKLQMTTSRRSKSCVSYFRFICLTCACMPEEFSGRRRQQRYGG